MPCTAPLECWLKAPPERGITFRRAEAWSDLKSMRVPCGQCLGCKLDRSGDWATRIHHEAKQHEQNSFLTLTFSDDCLPDDYSVHKRTMQLFMKRLRERVPVDVRFFLCGEYGEKTLRPHYHVILFGWDFADDRKLYSRTRTGYPVYKSPLLESVWPFGLCDIGTVTHQSAGYVARYVIKKINGDKAEEHYTRVHPVTGQVWRVNPEFILMSRRPGIGSSWYDRFKCDAFPSDFVVVDGVKKRIPAYYSKKLLAEAEAEALAIKQERKKRAALHADNNTDPRLLVRHESQILRAQQLKRELD